MKKTVKSRAFTLIELLVVVAIIGILAAVGTPIFQGFLESARTEAIKANHDRVVEYIQAETMRCEISGVGTKIYGGIYKCEDKSNSSSSQNSHAYYASVALGKNFQNPYGKVRHPHGAGETTDGVFVGNIIEYKDERSAGIVFLTGYDGSQQHRNCVHVKTCYDMNDCDNNFLYTHITPLHDGSKDYH